MDTSTDNKYWIPTSKGDYPQIVKGGEDKASGEDLYVGRGKYKECILPGKVYSGTYGPGLYVAHNGEERFVKDYEMLVTTKPVVWVSEHDGGYPLKAIPGGTDSDGNTLYIARARASDGGMCPGQLYPPHKRCVFSFEGKGHQHNQYDVLAEEG